jgi:hypothetical protein
LTRPGEKRKENNSQERTNAVSISLYGTALQRNTTVNLDWMHHGHGNYRNLHNKCVRDVANNGSDD